MVVHPLVQPAACLPVGWARRFQRDGLAVIREGFGVLSLETVSVATVVVVERGWQGCRLDRSGEISNRLVKLFLVDPDQPAIVVCCGMTVVIPNGFCVVRNGKILLPPRPPKIAALKPCVRVMRLQ